MNTQAWQRCPCASQGAGRQGRQPSGTSQLACPGAAQHRPAPRQQQRLHSISATPDDAPDAREAAQMDAIAEAMEARLQQLYERAPEDEQLEDLTGAAMEWDEEELMQEAQQLQQGKQDAASLASAMALPVRRCPLHALCTSVCYARERCTSFGLLRQSCAQASSHAPAQGLTPAEQHHGEVVQAAPGSAATEVTPPQTTALPPPDLDARETKRQRGARQVVSEVPLEQLPKVAVVGARCLL